MATPLYVLDLNNPDKPAEHVRLADGVFFGTNPDRDKVITDPRQIPTSGRLILYILGHAIPDALVVPALTQYIASRQTVSGGNSLLPEQAFAEFLIEQRGDNNTLIIWDLCFARSFELNAGPRWTSKPYVHIFGSAAHEQAWHTGDPSRETLFSLALKEATAPGNGFERWQELEDRLKGHLQPVQHPSIVGQLLPADFGLPPPQSMAAPLATSGTAQTSSLSAENVASASASVSAVASHILWQAIVKFLSFLFNHPSSGGSKGVKSPTTPASVQ